MLNQSLKLRTCITLLGCLSLPVMAQQSVGHEFLQDAERHGARVEIDEDQDEVFAAVQQGRIRPFSELYAAIDDQLYGRVIKVELEEDDNEWIYELKLVHDNKVIEVEYNATTLELMSIEGRNVLEFIKR